MLRNKTATECWNIRKYQIESIIDKFVPLKKTRKTVKSKQNVRDKVGPIEDSAGNIISQGFVMAEDLNGFFNSVFTREDISSEPVSYAKFQDANSDYLG